MSVFDQALNLGALMHQGEAERAAMTAAEMRAAHDHAQMMYRRAQQSDDWVQIDAYNRLANIAGLGQASVNTANQMAAAQERYSFGWSDPRAMYGLANVAPHTLVEVTPSRHPDIDDVFYRLADGDALDQLMVMAAVDMLGGSKLGRLVRKHVLPLMEAR